MSRALDALRRQAARAAYKAGFEVRGIGVLTSDLTLLARLLPRLGIDLAFDVGANRGQFARSLRGTGFAGHIVSFEPIAIVHDDLVVASSDDPRWHVAPRMALGREDTEIELRVSENTMSSSLLDILDRHLDAAPDSRTVGYERVPVRRLDSVAPAYLAGSRGGVFLKLDVQGTEHDVLDGARATLERVRLIELELSLTSLYAGQPLVAEMIALLHGLGFEPVALFPGFVDARRERMLQMDGVFVARDV